jgi:hypothetical protein
VRPFVLSRVPLAPHLTVERAADIATALMTDEVCDALVDDAGWSYDEYEDWLTETLVTLLMQPPPPGRP